MKKLLSVLLVLVLAMTVWACGTTKEEEKEKKGDTQNVEEEQDDSDLNYVKDKGEMIIGYTVYEPMNYTDKDGNFVGFDTELAEMVCEKLGVKPKFQEINWETKEVELKSRTIDCIWNGLTISDERQEQMAVTIPYVYNAQVVVMLKDNAYQDTKSLAGKAVCAEVGSAGEDVIHGEDADEGLSQASFVGKTVQTDCLMEVAAKTCDAAVLDYTLAKAMIGEGTDYPNLEIVDKLGEEYYGVAFRKDSSICEKVNSIFMELKNDGTLGKLAEKYGLTLAGEEQ